MFPGLHLATRLKHTAALRPCLHSGPPILEQPLRTLCRHLIIAKWRRVEDGDGGPEPLLLATLAELAKSRLVN